MTLLAFLEPYTSPAVTETREDRIGLWVERQNCIAQFEDKIGAIGVRIRRWISFHGLAFNILPDLRHFIGIVPCGISQHGVTNFQDLGVNATMADFDAAMVNSFDSVFGSLKT